MTDASDDTLAAGFKLTVNIYQSDNDLLVTAARVFKLTSKTAALIKAIRLLGAIAQRVLAQPVRGRLVWVVDPDPDNPESVRHEETLLLL